MLLVEEELVAAKWRRQLLHGQEIKWSELASIASAHEKQHAGRGRMNLVTLHDLATALEKRKTMAAHPDGAPEHLAGQQSARACKSFTRTKVIEMKQSLTGAFWVQDLPGAVHASFLKNEIEEHYTKFIPDTQCECARGRGTCLAAQTLEPAPHFL